MTTWSSPEVARIVAFVRETTGLVFSAARVADVEATIGRAMARAGVSHAAAFRKLLRDDGGVREALVAELTVGETYFQRDPAQFELLRRHVLPRLLAARPPHRPVRVWSAGCASGEEPYSVAMLFAELDALARCEIVGTDIARDRLEDAQRGIYSSWSLRSTPRETRERFFRQRGRFYELVPSLREQVDFRYLNLAEDRFPSLSIGIWGMDLILCRNVLIYFDRDTVQEVARRLIGSLSEDGWLVLGASDPPISELTECDVVLTDAGLVYRRPGAGDQSLVRERAPQPSVVPAAEDPAAATPARAAGDRAAADATAGDHAVRDAAVGDDARDEARDEARDDAAAATAQEAAALDGVFRHLAEEVRPEPEDDPAAAGAEAAAAHIVEAYGRRDFEAVIDAASSVAPSALDGAAWSAWIRALANQGALEEAGRIAARALDTHDATAELLYLHGVLLLQAGRAADAATALRRALYLDRTLVVAHVTLADAHQRTGRPDAARRSLRNADALLAAQPAEFIVPASDGERAGRLRELVRVKLRLLSEAA